MVQCRDANLAPSNCVAWSSSWHLWPQCKGTFVTFRSGSAAIKAAVYKKIIQYYKDMLLIIINLLLFVNMHNFTVNIQTKE